MNHSPSDSPQNVNRLIGLVLCIFATAVCIAYAFFRASLPDWWRHHGGGIPYVVFWITFLIMFFPSRKTILPICIGATLVTCALEFMQLWKPDWLAHFRATRFGAALLGSEFVWNDIPPYVLGGVIGFFVLWFAVRRR
ncbi:hypothetical protein Q31b_49890 [Novipirellula aureliae]|uniref:DUF2809 domain-containing protein n=1 Tax=Novipirellula aureliae TaxID=2527966 RepID=A0A5C6DLL5_9BACT|nr:DUF2809 domain-containing protein [Novipirellula aureliae]TWU36707.1 hypothetical protein Q31b_49890 [Novipirellula aureliae]